MSEYQYFHEQDITQIVAKIVALVQQRIDQAEADAVADRLAELGYVKVVRCRDCEKLNTVDCPCAWYPLDKTSIMDGLNGFCSWGERMNS